MLFLEATEEMTGLLPYKSTRSYFYPSSVSGSFVVSEPFQTRLVILSEVERGVWTKYKNACKHLCHQQCVFHCK